VSYWQRFFGLLIPFSFLIGGLAYVIAAPFLLFRWLGWPGFVLWVIGGVALLAIGKDEAGGW
jgi:hypothetical protein